MKWYFASRTRHQKKLASISRQLERQGEHIESSWVYIEDKLIPFHEHLEAVRELAKTDITGVLNSDILVLISDPAGTDMFAELGAALAKHAQSPESIRIYIVGEHARRSLMQLHPSITHMETLKEVFEKEGVNVASVTLPNFS